MKRTYLILLAAVLALPLVSCSKKSNQPVVAFVTNNVSDFWKIAHAGVKQAEKDFDCRCEFRMPTQGTPAEQKEILQDLVVKGVSGIAVSPVDPVAETPMLNEIAKKVNLICHDSDAPHSSRLCYVGTSNYAAGRAAGEELKKALPNGGKVMIYVGMLSAENARERNRGVLDAIKGTKIEVLDTMTDNTDHTKARANVEDTLVKHPDIAGLVGLWSYNGPAIADAVKAAKKEGKVKIVCFDEEDKTLAAVQDGTIFSTVVQKPYKFGYESVRILAAMARKEKVDIPANKILDQGVTIVNRDNVEEFWAELKRLKGGGS